MKTVMEVGARAIRKTEEDENTKSSPASLLAGYENPHAGSTDCVCLFFAFLFGFPVGLAQFGREHLARERRGLSSES
jgi:hypothetical protein